MITNEKNVLKVYLQQISYEKCEQHVGSNTRVRRCDRQTDTQTDRQTNTHTDRQTNKQRKADRQNDYIRQTK